MIPTVYGLQSCPGRMAFFFVSVIWVFKKTSLSSQKSGCDTLKRLCSQALDVATDLCLVVFLPTPTPTHAAKREQKHCCAHRKNKQCVGSHRDKPPCRFPGTELHLLSSV